MGLVLEPGAALPGLWCRGSSVPGVSWIGGRVPLGWCSPCGLDPPPGARLHLVRPGGRMSDALGRPGDGREVATGMAPAPAKGCHWDGTFSRFSASVVCRFLSNLFPEFPMLSFF